MPIKRDHAEVLTANEEREQCADARRRQCGKNRERMNVAFIQNAQNDVDGHQRRQNQDRLVRERSLESLRGSLKGRLNTRRQSDFVLGQVHRFHRVAQRRIRRKVER